MGVGAPMPKHHGGVGPMTESTLADHGGALPRGRFEAEHQALKPVQGSKRTRRQYLEHQGITQELIDVFTGRLKGIKSWSTDGGAFLSAIHRPEQAEHYARRVKAGRGFNYGANNPNPVKAFPEEKGGAHYRGWQAVEDQEHWKKTGKTLERQHSITIDVDTPGWAFEEGFSKEEWLAVLLVALEQKSCPLPYLVEDTGGEGWHLIWTHGEPLPLATARQVQHNLWAVLQCFGADADGLKIAHAFRLPHRRERQEGKPETAPRWARLSNQQSRQEDWAMVLDEENGTTPWVHMNSEAPSPVRQPLPPAVVSGKVGEAFAALADDLPDDVEGSHEQGVSLGMAFMAWAEETGLPLVTAEELLRRRWPERKTMWARDYSGARTSPAPLNKWIQDHGSAGTVRLLRECGGLRNPNSGPQAIEVGDVLMEPSSRLPELERDKAIRGELESGTGVSASPKSSPNALRREKLTLEEVAGPEYGAMMRGALWTMKHEPLTVAALCLQAVAGALRGRTVAQVEPMHTEALNLMTLLVAPSGSRKTMVLKALVRGPLLALAPEVKLLPQVPWPIGSKPPGDGKEDQRPTFPARICDTRATEEAMVQQLSVNEEAGGVPYTLCPDEVAAVIGGLGAGKGGASVLKELSTHLSAFEGEHVSYRTITHGVTECGRPNYGLVGTVQPMVLAALRKGKVIEGSGLWERLVLLPCPRPLLRSECPPAPGQDCWQAWSQVVQRVWNTERAVYKFPAEALEPIHALNMEGVKLLDDVSISPLERSVRSKLHGLAARYGALIHVLRAALSHEAPSEVLTADAIRVGAVLARNVAAATLSVWQGDLEDDRLTLRTYQREELAQGGFFLTRDLRAGYADYVRGSRNHDDWPGRVRANRWIGPVESGEQWVNGRAQKGWHLPRLDN